MLLLPLRRLVLLPQTRASTIASGSSRAELALVGAPRLFQTVPVIPASEVPSHVKTYRKWEKTLLEARLLNGAARLGRALLRLKSDPIIEESMYALVEGADRSRTLKASRELT